MRIVHLGHAGLDVETSSARVLLDPWLSPEGAFLASWFQYPDNSHVREAGVPTPHAIVMSHEHLDHVDPWFLATVDSNAPAVIPRYSSPALRRKIESAGPREIVELDPWEPLGIADGTTVYFVPEETPMYHDSAIVLTGDGRTLLDLNDARLSPAQFREVRTKAGGTVDFFSFQAAGASWHPSRYDVPESRRRELALRKRDAKLQYAERSVGVVEPIAAVPFAGPPCFLDPDLFWHNSDIPEGLVADQGQAVAAMHDHGVASALVMLPGDAWDAEARVKQADPTWDSFSLTNCIPYLELYAERRAATIESFVARHPVPSESLWEPFAEYFTRLLAMSPYFNRKIGMRVGFRIRGPGGGAWAVDFRPGSEGVSADEGVCQFQFTIESRWMAELISGGVRWEDFLLSRRFTCSRHPDLYNNHLFGLLKFAQSDPLDDVEHFETQLDTDESIIVNTGEASYQVQRYCPHSGNDLTMTGQVLPGQMLRCVAHRYEFDLESGTCVNGVCPPLRSTRIPERSSIDAALPRISA